MTEIAIIGAGMGGLSAAIHLRLAGYDVTIYEAGESAGGRANFLRSRGIRFDTGPTLLNYPWVFGDLFRAAGKALEDSVRLLPVDPSITYRWSDGAALTLSSNIEWLRSEFERTENGAGLGLDRFLADAREKFAITFEKLVSRNEDNPLRYFANLSLREVLRTALWRSMDAELGRYFRSRYIREALGSYAMYLGGSPFELPGLFTILPYGELAHGLWLPRGGMYALVEAVEGLAQELGVRIHKQTPVRRILHKNGRVTALEIEGGERLSYETVVSNVDVPQTLTVLLGQPRPRIAMSPSALTLYWVVDEKPRGLGHHTIFLPEDYRRVFRELMNAVAVPRDPAFYVSAPKGSEPEAGSPEGSGVSVLVPVPVLHRRANGDWEQDVARLKDTVLSRLSDSGVGFSAQQIRTETVFTPFDWRARFGLYDGSAFGAAHTLSQMGPFRPRNYSRHIRGLYFTGASTTPGTGVPMVTLSGRLVAERIQSHAR